MRAGNAELTSSDEEDEDELGPDARLRPDEAQDDEEYTDVIQAEEDMDDEREDNEQQ